MNGERGEIATGGHDEPLRANGVLHAHTMQINGGHFSSAGRDVMVHNYHYHSSHVASHSNDQRNVVLEALKKVSNFRQIQQDTLAKATPKTGEWILKYNMFTRWRDPTSDVKMICGSGIPGVGKTVLTSIMVNVVEKCPKEPGSPTCVGFIYIRYSDKVGLTVRDCLEVFVKQTVEQLEHSGLLQLAGEIYARHNLLQTRPTEDELLQLLKCFTETIRSTSYFLDALDEAPPEIQVDLVEKLASTGAKLFITSRPLKTLEERFPHAHHFSIVAQNSDLDLHINSKLDSSQDLRKVLEQGGPALRAYIVASVKRKCGGMFLHASLHLAALRHCRSVSDVRETLDRFPPKIEDIYRDAWKRIVKQASNGDVYVQTCIVWVLNAPKSLTIAELQHATAICLETHKFEPERVINKDLLVGLCHGLLVVDETTGLVRLVHYTAKETLDRLIVEKFPRLHWLMASLCMGCLIQYGFQDWKGCAESFKRTMEHDPLLPYAYHAWSIHARNSLGDPTTTSQIKAFVRKSQSFPIKLAQICSTVDRLGPLHVAAFFNLPISLARSNLVNGLNPNPRTSLFEETPLHLACRHTSDLSAFQELLSLTLVDVNATNIWRQTPLIRACQLGNVGAVELLLSQPKIRLDPTDKDGLTAFTWAAKKGNKALLKAILAHSHTEIHSSDGGGRTALSWTCQYGYFPIVELLLSRSQSEVHLVDKAGRTPLSWAATSKCIDTLQLILSHPHHDIHAADKDGRTPLSWASSDGGEEAVKVLLKHPQINVNQVDKDGRSPLSWASQHRQEAAVKVLLADPRTEVNLADAEGWSPLIWATKWHATASIRALLAHPQTNVNIQDKHGVTPLMRALHPSTGNTAFALLLAHPMINVNLPDNEGHTPLHVASRIGFDNDRKIRALLARSDIDINVQDIHGRTPLSWASKCSDSLAAHEKEGAVKLLLAHPDIKVNLVDRDGRTPLIWVAMQKRILGAEEHHRRHVVIAQALLGHPQTDVNLADSKGRTALNWASKRGHKDIVKLLLDHPNIQLEVGPGRRIGQLLDSTVEGIRDLLRK